MSQKTLTFSGIREVRFGNHKFLDSTPVEIGTFTVDRPGEVIFTGIKVEGGPDLSKYKGRIGLNSIGFQVNTSECDGYGVSFLCVANARHTGYLFSVGFVDPHEDRPDGCEAYLTEEQFQACRTFVLKGLGMIQ